MRVLVLDNYDSFTFNLVQYLGELGAEPLVVRNDQMPPAEALLLKPDRLVVSPGPGRPEEAGYSIEYISELGPSIPTLGVCLGHQAIVVAYGGTGIFTGLSNPFTATRYHSLAASRVPDELEECAWSEEGVVQGVRHRRYPVVGVQFHPESILTVEGKALLANFLSG